MIGAFFSDLRGVAATLDGVEAGLREREEMDVEGPRHHALQQTALHRFKGDVVDTKARMKTLQPTVVNLQKFGGLKEISCELLSLQRRRVDAARDALARYGYEPPPPAKLHKLDVDQHKNNNNTNNSTKNNEMKRSSSSSKAAEFEKEKENFSSHHHSNNGVVSGSGGGGRVFDAPPIDVDEEMGDVDDDDVLEEDDLADGRETSNRRPSDDIASATTTKIMTMTTTKQDRDHLRPSYNAGVVGDFPESPQCPILHSVGAVASAVVHLPPPPNGYATFTASAAAAAGGIADDDDEEEEEDDSVLAMELPPTPVYPEMTWKPDRDLPPPTAAAPPMGDDLAAASAASTAPPLLPRTPAPSFALVHTPTPPTLLSVSKKALDVTKIDFSGLEDGQVFHTGLTPKTPELHSVLTAMPTSQPADAKPPTMPTRGGFLDTPSEGRATPSSPDSQQSFESLKRALKFNAAEAPLPPLPSTAAAAAAAFMKPVSFVEFEQFKQQKVEGISRDLLNNAIKSLNAVFREREAAKESLDLPQTQVDALFNEDNDLRLGTKIILMLLKFKRIDCRSANGQSYVSPRSDDDDSMLDLTNYDD